MDGKLINMLILNEQIEAKIELCLFSKADEGLHALLAGREKITGRNTNVDLRDWRGLKLVGENRQARFNVVKTGLAVSCQGVGSPCPPFYNGSENRKPKSLERMFGHDRYDRPLPPR